MRNLDYLKNAKYRIASIAKEVLKDVDGVRQIIICKIINV